MYYSDNLNHYAKNIFNYSDTIWCVKCRFPEHQHDAPVYALPPDIAKRNPFPEDCVHIKNTFIYSLTASLWNVNIFFVSQGFKVLEEQHSTCKDLTILFEKLKWILFFLFSPEKSSKNIENSFIVSYWLRDWLNLNHTQNASFFFQCVKIGVRWRQLDTSLPILHPRKGGNMHSFFNDI